MKVLLIGGSHAGEIMDIDGDINRIILKPALQGFQTKVGDPDPEVYHRATITDASGKDHVVYAAEGVDALHALLESYRKA